MAKTESPDPVCASRPSSCMTALQARRPLVGMPNSQGDDEWSTAVRPVGRNEISHICDPGQLAFYVAQRPKPSSVAFGALGHCLIKGQSLTPLDRYGRYSPSHGRLDVPTIYLPLRGLHSTQNTGHLNVPGHPASTSAPISGRTALLPLLELGTLCHSPASPGQLQTQAQKQRRDTHWTEGRLPGPPLTPPGN